MATHLSAVAGERRCLNCGGHVTEQFCRVFGDLDDRVHRCPSCDNGNRISRGSAAGLDVNLRDPQDAPRRLGGERP
ncbi:DUF7563 family protein [Haloprofundus halobius]|uniref:DUF7563 family protein n=1 Tax=Haloprofundus halobius TaxID=2876194 RepID=UPI001CCAE086